MPLLETLTATGLMSLLALMGFASYTTWQNHKILEASVREVELAIHTAKEMSILKGESVYLCTSADHMNCDDHWQGGELIVYTSSKPSEIQTIQQIFPPLPASIRVNFTGFKKYHYLYFMENGEVANNGKFTLQNQDKQIILNLSKTGVINTQD